MYAQHGLELNSEKSPGSFVVAKSSVFTVNSVFKMSYAKGDLICTVLLKKEIGGLMQVDVLSEFT